MEYTDIDFKRLKRISYQSGAIRRALARNAEPNRKLYEGDSLVYKIWKKKSRLSRLILIDGEIIQVDNNCDEDGYERILGFLCGLYDAEVCQGFVEGIYSNKKLVGYVSTKGIPLREGEIVSEDCTKFVDRLIEKSLESGFIFRDLHPGNIVRLPSGALSLIDLDAPIADLPSLDLNVEVQTGSLRRQRMPQYREFILNYFDLRCNDAALVKARESLKARPQPFSGVRLFSNEDAPEGPSRPLPGTKKSLLQFVPTKNC